jgi:membrane protein implicated in regulation of membrane protease activity
MIAIDIPVYWICLIAGTALLLVSIILGDLFDGVFGAIGLDIDVAGGGTMPPLLAFFALFGAGGLIGESYGILGDPVICGLVFGVAGAAGAALFFRLIRRSEGPPARGLDRLTGTTGRVTIAIDPGSVGEVELVTRGAPQRFMAIYAAGVPAGSIIRVTGSVGSTLTIEPATAGGETAS